MSIRGIDSQIMIARSADLARDASAIQKRPEVVSDYKAVQAQIEIAREQTTIKETQETEAMKKMRSDADGGGYGASGGGDFDEQPEHSDDGDGIISRGIYVSPGDNVIDIKV